MLRLIISMLILLQMLLPTALMAEDAVPLPATFKLDEEIVKDSYPYAGLAFYLGKVDYFLWQNGHIQSLEDAQQFRLSSADKLMMVGRSKLAMVSGVEAALHQSSDGSWISNLPLDDYMILIAKHEITHQDASLRPLRYPHLVPPFSWLAIAAEEALLLTHYFIPHWGGAIIIFAIWLRLLLWPLFHWVGQLQKQINQIKAKLEPELAAIKQQYKGEEAHNHIMQAHKNHGVTPFYTLKTMLGLAIQIPLFIAVFNALATLDGLYHQPFLWMDDLARPDAIFSWQNMTIPMIGQSFNLLPIIMTFLSLLAAYWHVSPNASAAELKRQKRNLFLLALVFFILFYPFPASMVLYWAMVNLLLVCESLRKQYA